MNSKLLLMNIAIFSVSNFTELSQDTPSCFLCDDGACIEPTLPVYSIELGKKWWWLCDNYNHCKDGTDERPGKNVINTHFRFIKSIAIGMLKLFRFTTLTDKRNQSVWELALYTPLLKLVIDHIVVTSSFK